jgi:hypothetical protein
MAHVIRCWPTTVYPGEIEDECPEAQVDIDVLLSQMRAQGPSPAGYDVKNLGKPRGGLWQANLKVEKRQVRVLYAPYGNKIVLFRIHKKGSRQEQERAYVLAVDRKADYEAKLREAEAKQRKLDRDNGGSRQLH